MKKITFRNGDQMSVLGLVPWKSKPREVYEAIKVGYRHFDCVKIYSNEKEIGEALYFAFQKQWIKREDIWVTSKLWNNSHCLEHVILALMNTLNELQLDYLDLYLIHWSVALMYNVTYPHEVDVFLSPLEAPLLNTWSQMEESLVLGYSKHIGVSNFSKNNLDHLIENSEVIPEINQIELHPYFPQTELIEYCKSCGVIVEAYSPLGSMDRPNALKEDNDLIFLETLC